MTTAVGIPANVLIAWQALPDRECPCRRKCGRTVKIMCENGWNDIGDWLPEKIAESPLDVDLLVPVVIYWSPAAQGSQEAFDRELDRLEVELGPLVAAIDDAEYLARRGGDCPPVGVVLVSTRTASCVRPSA
jgi:hypothetical protein